MNWTSIAAVVAVVILGAVVLLQLALAAGVPWGHLAWGGRDRVLPGGRRAASLVAAAVLAMAGWVVLARAGIVWPGPEPTWVRVGAWIFCGLFALNTVGNLASASRWERAVMTPSTAILVVCFAVVGL